MVYSRKKEKKKKRKISISLSSYSSVSIDSQEEERRKRIRRKKIRNKNYKRESVSEDNPLANYYKNVMANGPSRCITNTGSLGPREVWDGFQWVKKGNTLGAMDPAVMNQTKKMRRVQLSNLPLYLNIDEESIKKVVSDYLIRNYLADPNNSSPILTCEINKKDKTCVLELSSVEEANRFSKIKDITILNVTCKVTKLGESMYGSTLNMAAILQNANNIAKAQAAAYQAINMMSTSDGRLELDAKDLNMESRIP